MSTDDRAIASRAFDTNDHSVQKWWRHRFVHHFVLFDPSVEVDEELRNILISHTDFAVVGSGELAVLSAQYLTFLHTDLSVGQSQVKRVKQSNNLTTNAVMQ